jgi:hypothetical protein
MGVVITHPKAKDMKVCNPIQLFFMALFENGYINPPRVS